MIVDSSIDNLISKKLIADNEIKSIEHISSGKLSAGKLADPLQWQVLSVLGVTDKPINEYALRLFKRGNQVEDWLISQLDDVVETQKKVEYKGVVGIIDAVVNTEDFNFKCGIIPYEIKSVKNSKYKRIIDEGAPQTSHLLQACLYALAENTQYFAIAYIAADDLRIHTFILETDKYKQLVLEAINEYDEAIRRGRVPVFKAKEKWQENKQYAKYQDWMELDEKQCIEKLQNEYPKAYLKLKEVK